MSPRVCSQHSVTQFRDFTQMEATRPREHDLDERLLVQRLGWPTGETARRELVRCVRPVGSDDVVNALDPPDPDHRVKENVDEPPPRDHRDHGLDERLDVGPVLVRASLPRWLR
jgi:hypothetical protein